jgi:hypothetical protein
MNTETKSCRRKRLPMKAITIRSRAFQALGISIIVAAAGLGGTIAVHADPAAGETVVFVCLHGSVKSQMAAAQFNRLAKERGLTVTAISRAVAAERRFPMAFGQHWPAKDLHPPAKFRPTSRRMKRHTPLRCSRSTMCRPTKEARRALPVGQTSRL